MTVADTRSRDLKRRDGPSREELLDETNRDEWMAANFLHSAIDVDQVLLFKFEQIMDDLPEEFLQENRDRIQEIFDLIMRHGKLLREARSYVTREFPARATWPESKRIIRR